METGKPDLFVLVDSPLWLYPASVRNLLIPLADCCQSGLVLIYIPSDDAHRIAGVLPKTNRNGYLPCCLHGRGTGAALYVFSDLLLHLEYFSHVAQHVSSVGLLEKHDLKLNLPRREKLTPK